MKSKLDGLRRKLDRLDPAAGVCSACAGPPEMLEVTQVMAGEGEGADVPDVPLERPCLSPDTCRGAGRVRQYLIVHQTAADDPPGGDDGLADDRPPGGGESPVLEAIGV